MKTLMLLAMLTVGALVLSSTSEVKADHWGGCGPSYGGSYYGGYSYAPSYYAPVYGYGPVNSFGYAYPRSGFYYGSPGFSLSIGSGYRGYGYGGYGGYGRGWGGGHHHHH